MEIGSGDYPHGANLGYWHSDIRYPLPHQELCCDLKSLPFRDCSLDGISVMHTLEHIPWRDVPLVLKGLYDALKEGGRLVVVVPNLLYGAYEFLRPLREGEDLKTHIQTVVEGFYGNQDYPENFHMSGFTPGFLCQLFIDAGFSRVEQPGGWLIDNLAVWGYK